MIGWRRGDRRHRHVRKVFCNLHKKRGRHFLRCGQTGAVRLNELLFRQVGFLRFDLAPQGAPIVGAICQPFHIASRVTAELDQRLVRQAAGLSSPSYRAADRHRLALSIVR